MDQLLKIRKISILTLPISVLIAITSISGIFFHSTYSRETQNYIAQAVGQDIINLIFVIPLFLISFIMMNKNSKRALFIWTGTLIYIIYTFVIFCFGVHFNALFLVYCLTLSLSFFLLVTVMSQLEYSAIREWYGEKTPRKSTAIYLFIIAGLFYLIWLKEIIPGIVGGKTPQSIVESGLLTNPVFVLDLVFVLPALIITGIKLRRKSPFAFFLAPTFLSFFIVMTMAIGGMVLLMVLRNQNGDLALSAIFGCLFVVSIFFLIKFIRCCKK